MITWHCYRCEQPTDDVLDTLIAWLDRCPRCGRSRATGLLSDREKPSDAPIDWEPPLKRKDKPVPGDNR